MKQFKRTLLSSIIAAGVISVTGCTSHDTVTAPQEDKPNVVVIFLDDAGYADIGANGGTLATPNLDKMAEEGVNFSSFYTSSPVSSPSRAGLLTGRLGNRNGMWGDRNPVFFEDDPDGLPKSENTMAEMLRNNGYDTMMLGKWHLGIGKDGVEHIPTRHGFDNWYGIPTSNDMFFTNPDWQNKRIMTLIGEGKLKKVLPEIMARESVIADENGWGTQDAYAVPVYQSSVSESGFKDTIVGEMEQATFTQDLTQHAVSYIEENKDAPFFLYMAYPQNHVPLFASEKFRGTTDSPYGDVMAEIDDSVGQILTSLKEQGIDENTIVVFTSDNGPWLRYENVGASGSALPFRDGKNATYEGGVRVPGIIRWSGTIEPTQSDAMISTLDMLPTLANLTGSELPAVKLDGFDMSAVLLEQEASPRTEMPYYYMGKLQAFRAGDWKIHFIKSGLMGKTVLKKPEIYNIADDIDESENLADSHPEVLKAMIEKASTYDQSIGPWSESLFNL